VALVLHTSGTTACPRLVPLTHANLCHTMRATAQCLELTAADRSMIVMPLFHVHGLIGALGASLWAGASVVATGPFNPARVLGFLEEFRPTWLSAVPTIYQAILAAAGGHPAALRAHGLRFLRSCSASLAPAVMAELEAAFGVPVVEAYGMTENAHTICCNPLPPRMRKPGSVGLPVAAEVGVIDADGKLLGTGATGELVIRGPSVTAGYESNPEANAAAFVNGWFRTGDVGRIDEEGYVFLTGRLKEMVNRAGENVAPREVEEALLSHPAVAEAVAFGVPDGILGEDLVAAVILRAGITCGPGELVRHVSGQLVEAKVPREVLIVETIPKGPTGKLQRIGLAERLGLAGEPAPDVRSEMPSESETVTEEEETIRAVVLGLWEELLTVRPIGLHDDFLELGGQSLALTRLGARIRAIFGVDVTLRALFDAPTVAGHARLVFELLLMQIETLAEEEPTGQGQTPPSPTGQGRTTQ
jgi:acyl-CoA synthetase (AMP-forming)/AMP-acid ligase II/aryl carrier-like protein